MAREKCRHESIIGERRENIKMYQRRAGISIGGINNRLGIFMCARIARRISGALSSIEINRASSEMAASAASASAMA